MLATLLAPEVEDLVPATWPEIPDKPLHVLVDDGRLFGWVLREPPLKTGKLPDLEIEGWLCPQIPTNDEGCSCWLSDVEEGEEGDS